jgi:C-terminal processing protease CtpA/Prc
MGKSASFEFRISQDRLECDSGTDLRTAIAGLTAGADRLIIDLRGNIGGSLGFSMLASYLCPGKRPIGYSVTPAAVRRGFDKDRLPSVPMPRNKLSLILTLSQFAFRDKSVILLTQGLGPWPFHGRVVILVNEWTNSAAEMVASFAKENRLAQLVKRFCHSVTLIRRAGSV